MWSVRKVRYLYYVYNVVIYILVLDRQRSRSIRQLQVNMRVILSRITTGSAYRDPVSSMPANKFTTYRFSTLSLTKKFNENVSLRDI